MTRFNRKSVSVSVSSDDEVLTLDEIKDILGVDGTTNDARIEMLVSAATEAVKQYLRVGLKTETLILRADRFTGDPDAALDRLGPGIHTASVPYVLGYAGQDIELPFGPVQSVTSVVTYNRSDTAATFSASSYGVDLAGGRLFLNEGQTWPSDLRSYNAVEVTYIAGYGAANVPAPIREAIGLYTEQLYDNCDGLTAQVKGLLAPYRRLDGLQYG